MLNEPLLTLLDFARFSYNVQKVTLSRCLSFNFVLQSFEFLLILLELHDLLFQVDESLSGIAALVKLPVWVLLIKARLSDFLIFYQRAWVAFHEVFDQGHQLVAVHKRATEVKVAI